MTIKIIKTCWGVYTHLERSKNTPRIITETELQTLYNKLEAMDQILFQTLGNCAILSV